MSLTSGKQITAVVCASVTMLVGPALVLHGVIRQHPANSLTGVAVTMIALTLIILLVVHGWVTSTGAERARLSADQQAAQEEKARYFAAQAALENEQQRLHRDLAAERVALEERAKVERAATAAEFEERRAALVSETMDATFRMIRNGQFTNDRPRGKVIEFPQQQAEPARKRPREHGVVGP